MKFLRMITLFVFSISFLQAMHEGTVKTENAAERKAREELNTREEDIQKQKAKIEELEKKGKYEEAKEEGKSLEKLLDSQINDLRKFSVDFPGGREEANVAEGKAEAEKAIIQKKIVELEQAIKESGTSLIPEPVTFNIGADFADFQAEIEQDKIISPGFAKQMEIFFNKFKAKVYELPVIGNPDKAYKARDKLNNIYTNLGNIEDQIGNLQNWGDYLLNTAHIGNDSFKIQTHIRNFDNYVKVIEELNKRIQKNEGGAQEEKLKLQQKALQDLVLNVAHDMDRFSEKIKQLKEQPSTSSVSDLDAQLNYIKSFIKDLLQVDLDLYSRTEAEKKQAAQADVEYVKNFLTGKETLAFNDTVDAFISTLRTQPAEVGNWATFADYKALKDYLNAIEGLDTVAMTNNRELQDYEKYTFSQTLKEAYFKIAKELKQRQERLSKIQPRTKALEAELRYIDDLFKTMYDRGTGWFYYEEAYNDKIIANSALRQPRNEVEKITRDNENANTRTNEVAKIASDLANIEKSLFASKSSGQIKVPTDFIKTYEDFGKQVTELLRIVNNPATAPSRDTLKKIKQLKRQYKAIQDALELYGRTVHSFEDAPSEETEKKLAEIYIDVLNKQAVLEKRRADYSSALLVVGNDGNAFNVDKIDRTYAQQLQKKNDNKVTDATVSKAVTDIRSATKNPLGYTEATPERIAEYRDRLFSKMVGSSTGSTGKDQTTIGDGGYDI